MLFKQVILIIGLVVTFIPVSTVFALDTQEFQTCEGKKIKKGKKRHCFRDLVRKWEYRMQSLNSLYYSPNDTAPEDSEELVACLRMKIKNGVKRGCLRSLVRYREDEICDSYPDACTDSNGIRVIDPCEFGARPPVPKGCRIT